MQAGKQIPKWRRSWRRSVSANAFSVALESRYLHVANVSTIATDEEVRNLFASQATLEKVQRRQEIGREDGEGEREECFTRAYLVTLATIGDGRKAKRKLNQYSFYGSHLAVSYAPEEESVSETREKLRQRRAVVAVTADKHKRQREAILNAVDNAKNELGPIRMPNLFVTADGNVGKKREREQQVQRVGKKFKAQ